MIGADIVEEQMTNRGQIVNEHPIVPLSEPEVGSLLGPLATIMGHCTINSSHYKGAAPL